MKELHQRFENLRTKALRESLWTYTFEDQTTTLLEGDMIEQEKEVRKIRFIGKYEDDRGRVRSVLEVTTPEQYERCNPLSREQAAVEILRLIEPQSTLRSKFSFQAFVEAYQRAYNN
ncbi:MAG: hypothetical protein AABX10_02410 [Nanoarchaeota archaeon]